MAPRVARPRLRDEEGARVGLVAARLARLLRRVTQAERISSAVVGHHSPHFHLHLFLRHPGAPREHWFTGLDEWEGSPIGGAAEIAALVLRLRAADPAFAPRGSG
jgi:diadenosine tetraphosphate (Ap4A) HIT family hydrolase